MHTENTQKHNKLVLIASSFLPFYIQVTLSLWICSNQILFGYERDSGEKLQYKLVDFDHNSIPLIQYNCFKILDPLSFGFSYTGESERDWFHIAEVTEVNTTHPTYISSIDSVTLNSALFPTSYTELDGGPKRLTFLEDKDEILELFSKRIADETAFFLSKSTREVENSPNSRPEKIGEERKSTQTKFDYTIIIIILILAFIIYFAAYLSPSINSKSTTREVRSKRKRWLTQLHFSGRVDNATYNFLLSQIDDLPRLIKAKEFAHLDLPTSGADSELEVALRRRNRGESVVNTKETSLERTSR